MGQQDTPVEMTTRAAEEKKDFPVLAHRRFLLFSFFVGFSMLEVRPHLHNPFVSEVGYHTNRDPVWLR